MNSTRRQPQNTRAPRSKIAGIIFASFALLIGLSSCLSTRSNPTSAVFNPDDPQLAQCLKEVNLLRQDAGLPAVVFSVELSEGCFAHARYLSFNWGKSEVAGLKAHQEVQGLGGYSAAGSKAGSSAVINYLPPVESVRSWKGTFYHRIPLLQPQLATIGVAWVKGGPGYICLVDCMSGLKGAPDRDWVAYPAPDQKNVPCFGVQEIPDPTNADTQFGFPITVYFAKFQTVTQAHMVLKDQGGKTVACFSSDPEHPATFFSQWSSVVLIPKSPLKAHTVYTVQLDCLANGAPVSSNWSFTTQ